MDFSGMDFVTVLFYRVHFCTAHSSQLSVWRENCSFLFEAIDLLLLRLFIDWFWLSTYHTITLLRHHRFTDRFILLYNMVLKPGFTGSFILSPTHTSSTFTVLLQNFFKGSSQISTFSSKAIGLHVMWQFFSKLV